MSEFNAPAATYKLNVLASAVGRFAASDSPQTERQTIEFLDRSIEDLATNDVPPVPHTEPELLRQAAIFDNKLLDQLENGPAAEMLDSPRLKRTRSLVSDHLRFCMNDSTTKELLVSPEEIATAYGTPTLWEEAQGLVEDEIKRYGKQTQHPDIPPVLRRRVTLEGTKDLLNFTWRNVLMVDETPDVNIYLTDQTSNYHVFWSPTSDALDYATPASYDLATQLSFDIPHNATHLAHLNALDAELGVERYDDSMPQRAYFEALTVFSEYITHELSSTNAEFGVELAKVLKIDPSEMAPEALSKWITQDRAYESKLRAVRLEADRLMVQGRSFDQTIQSISQKFGIPIDHATSEVAKYLPWTGLGAVYTFGYRKLISLGKATVSEAMFNNSGEAVQSWTEATGN